MPENEEEGFVVRDRRRFMSDAPATDTAAPTQTETATPPPLPSTPQASAGAPLSAPIMQVDDDAAAFVGPNGQPYSPEDMRAAFAEAYETASPEERAEMDAALAEAQGGASAQDIPDIYSILALFLGEIRNIAWLRMGLVANPNTGEIERDMDQAKVAIDTVSFLADQLASVVAPEERLPLKAMVSDLQINFVEQSKRAG